jgi:8-oxo-dGTP pyrophosphatase MutT (NUDIX family)
MAASLGVSQLRIEFCTGGSEPEESPLLEAVAREWLMKI